MENITNRRGNQLRNICVRSQKHNDKIEKIGSAYITSLFSDLLGPPVDVSIKN